MCDATTEEGVPLACLVLQSLGGDHKVQQGDLHANLWEVVRVPELGGDVESEVLAVLHRGVAQSDAVAPALLEDLLEQKRLQGRIQLLANVFQQYRLSKLRSLVHIWEVRLKMESVRMYVGSTFDRRGGEM